MDDVTAEKGTYIIVYYHDLLNDNEKKALQHYRSTIKLDGDYGGPRERMYLKSGKLSTDPAILNYLKEGYEQFAINCANRVLRDSPGEVFFNLCPQCKKLARTPVAKQCQFCGYGRH